jgi:hypothetical protein
VLRIPTATPPSPPSSGREIPWRRIDDLSVAAHNIAGMTTYPEIELCLGGPPPGMSVWGRAAGPGQGTSLRSARRTRRSSPSPTESTAVNSFRPPAVGVDPLRTLRRRRGQRQVQDRDALHRRCAHTDGGDLPILGLSPRPRTVAGAHGRSIDEHRGLPHAGARRWWCEMMRTHDGSSGSVGAGVVRGAHCATDGSRRICRAPSRQGRSRCDRLATGPQPAVLVRVGGQVQEVLRRTVGR